MGQEKFSCYATQKTYNHISAAVTVGVRLPYSDFGLPSQVHSGKSCCRTPTCVQLSVSINLKPTTLDHWFYWIIDYNTLL